MKQSFISTTDLVAQLSEPSKTAHQSFFNSSPALRKCKQQVQDYYGQCIAEGGIMDRVETGYYVNRLPSLIDDTKTLAYSRFKLLNKIGCSRAPLIVDVHRRFTQVVHNDVMDIFSSLSSYKVGIVDRTMSYMLAFSFVCFLISVVFEFYNISAAFAPITLIATWAWYTSVPPTEFSLVKIFRIVDLLSEADLHDVFEFEEVDTSYLLTLTANIKTEQGEYEDANVVFHVCTFLRNLYPTSKVAKEIGVQRCIKFINENCDIGHCEVYGVAILAYDWYARGTVYNNWEFSETH